MKNKQLRSVFILLLCAFVWGSTFVAQSSAAESVPAFTFLAARSYIGGVALLLIALLFYKKDPQKYGVKKPKTLLFAGISCGCALFVASACQQFGMTLGTDAGKAGFLTSLYLVFVPLLHFLIYRRKPGLFVPIGSCMALIGLYFLCDLSGSTGMSTADLVTALCGLCFAVHILIIDRYAGDLNGLHLSCIQFLICALLSTVGSLLFEAPSAQLIDAAIGPILYAGLFSSALGYTLQILGQKDCPPAAATVIMSLESVFALLSQVAVAWLCHNPIAISLSELFGCSLMLAGVLLVQIPKRGNTT